MKQNQRKKLSVLNVKKKGHITPNCKKEKINVFSDDEDEDKYHEEASEESISSETEKSKKFKKQNRKLSLPNKYVNCISINIS